MKVSVAIFACLLWQFAAAVIPPTAAASAADELVQCCCCGPVQTCTCGCSKPAQDEEENQESTQVSGCSCDNLPPATPHSVSIRISQLRKLSLEAPAPLSVGADDLCKDLDIREVAHGPPPDLARISTFILII